MHRKDLFGQLIYEIVEKGIMYRSQKPPPIYKEDIVDLNSQLGKLGCKIKQLLEPKFLNSLPINPNKYEQKIDESNKKTNQHNLTFPYNDLKNQLIEIQTLSPQERGFSFEKYLNYVFSIFKLEPRNSFKLLGQQIDGSFALNTNIYLIEAKWQNEPTRLSDLLIFQGKVDSKAKWTRGLFISFNGFTEECLKSFTKGRTLQIILMDGKDLILLLEKEIPLKNIIQLKERNAAEEGNPYVDVYSLISKYPNTLFE